MQTRPARVIALTTRRDGNLMAVVECRIGLGVERKTMSLPPTTVISEGQEITVGVAHGDVVSLVDAPDQVPDVAADPEAAARDMIRRVREAFGPVEIRVFETGEFGRRLVSSNVRGEVRDAA